MRGAIPPLPRNSSGRGAHLSTGHVMSWYLVGQRDNYDLMKTNGGVKVWRQAFLISALDGCDYSVLRSDCFIPGIDWIGGKDKNSCHFREWNPGRPLRSHSMY